MKLNKFIIAAAAVALAALTSPAQDLVKTNLPFSGTTNLANTCYPQTGQFVSIAGSSTITLQLNAKQVGSAIETTNTVTATICPILDDYSMVKGFGVATNVSVSATFKVVDTNYNSWIAEVASSNFYGAKSVSVRTLAYAGTNSVTIRSLRFGTK